MRLFNFRALRHWVLLTLLVGSTTLAAQEPPGGGPFRVQFGKGGISSLRYVGDRYDTEYIAPDRVFGHVMIRYQMGDNPWRNFSTLDPDNKSRQRVSDPGDARQLQTIVYNESDWEDYFADLELTEAFRVDGQALYWTLHFRNVTHKPLVLGDVEFPLPFNTEKRWDKTITTTQRLEEHQFVSGHNSFIYWMRPNAEGPYLVMVPVMVCPLFESNRMERNFAPAKLEFSDRGGVFIHAGFRAEEDTKRGGNWRQPRTGYTLSPKFTPGDELTYIFKFRWANGYDGVRDVLYEEGLLDVNVAPGMTVPKGLDALVSIRSRNPIHDLIPEFPEETQVEEQEGKAKDTHVYKVSFSKLGENKLTVKFGEDRYTVLEFFVVEPLATLIKKRAAFIVDKQQHRDPAKWYNGLFSEWDMRNKVLRSPEDTDGMHGYMVASDDPGLCKAPYIAGKNVDYPNAREIEAVEYYLEHFVWGGLQMTDQEKYPYAVYGIPNWQVNRDSKPADRDGWTEHVWRVFDYPHVVHLYWNMYRVAKFYPELTHYLDKDGYLQRAFGTAMAYYTVPFEVAGWSAEQLGNYDELVIADLLKELDAVGWKEKADQLRRAWESKVEHFVNDRPNLYWSEYAYDPTGFESHHAFAKYAMEEASKPNSTLKVKPEDVPDFMQEEINGNILTRGWLETSYWKLGVERAMRYTAQMGGWAILDYALYYAKDPAPYLRLGYASLLSSWALMNSGTKKTNYGFWYPGPENDGGAGSAFVSQPYGRTWAGKNQPRGPWNYSAEIDLGFGAALRTAATIVAQDPIFGLIAYGGRLERAGDRLEVVPLDGLRRRFHVIRDDARLHLTLDRDGFAAGEPIRFDEGLSEISFAIENRTPGATREHTAEMTLSGLPGRSYDILLDGTVLREIKGGSTPNKIPLPVGKPETQIVIRQNG